MPPAATLANPPDRIDIARAHVALLMNPGSGRKEGRRLLDGLRTRLEPAVGRLTVHPAGREAPIAQAVARARDEGAEVVAVFGGDGSQNAAAGALAGTGTPLAILPGGTFNYAARDLGIETLEDGIAALLGGRLRPHDLARLNDRVVLNNAAFGVYPEILERREAFYRRWGRSRIGAYWAVLMTLLDLRAPLVFDIEAGGVLRHFETPLVFAARSAVQLDSLGLEGAEAVREGHAVLFLARATGRLGLVAASLRLATGRVRRGTDFEVVVADDVTIDTARRRKIVAFDGEKAWMDAPFRLRVWPGALTVLAPPATAP
jgi:diacylglycerol kinase family enzyme